jgi:hypothetical protein
MPITSNHIKRVMLSRFLKKYVPKSKTGTMNQSRAKPNFNDTIGCVLIIEAIKSHPM